MLWKTHLAFGFLCALLVTPLVKTGNIYIFFSLVLFGSLIPDVDTPNSKLGRKLGILSKFFSWIAGHRGVFHSIFFAFLLPGLIWYFVSKVYGFALFVGYLSHLIIDGFTVAGINFLHPISKLHLSGFVETGSVSENIVLMGLIGISVFVIFF